MTWNEQEDYASHGASVGVWNVVPNVYLTLGEQGKIEVY